MIDHKFLTSFSGTIEPVRVSGRYKVALFLVALAMVMLPVIYLGLLAGIAAGMYFYLINVMPKILSFHGGSVFRFALGVAPLVSGGVLLYFMLKPFGSHGQPPATKQLKPEDEPLLFSFVEEVCKRVGAPVPNQIDASCDINAYASFRRGFDSLFGTDLKLTIGLPLVAGLDLRQFAGVLAHEFGHFTQGTAMRCNFVIQSVNNWFTRFVFVEKPQIDQMFSEWAEKQIGVVSIVVLVARFCVWVTTGLLRALMYVGFLISHNLLRQMEFDADRHEIRLAGSDAFISTTQRIRVLTAAMHGAQDDLFHAQNEAKLPDNLPSLLRAHVTRLHPEAEPTIIKQIDNETTGRWDTHPSDAERIENAKDEKAAGIFALPDLAEELFADFDALSCEVTQMYFRDIFGETIKAQKIMATSDILQEQDTQRQETMALWRLTLGSMLVTPHFLPNGKRFAPTPREEIVATLGEARQEAADLMTLAGRENKRLNEACHQRTLALQARALLRAGFNINSEEFDLSEGTLKAANARIEETSRERKSARNNLQRVVELARTRVEAAMALLEQPENGTRAPDGKSLVPEASESLPVLQTLLSQNEMMRDLQDAYHILLIYLNNLAGNEAQLETALTNVLRQCSILLNRLRQGLGDKKYPFQHASGEITLKAFLLPKIPRWQDIDALLPALEDFLYKRNALHIRLAGRLAMIAETVEGELGLEPLEVAVEEELAETEAE